jgi:hypothetical protein
MSKKKILIGTGIFTIISVIILSTIGGIFVLFNPLGEVSAEETFKNSQDVMKDVKSYTSELEMEMTIDMKTQYGENESEVKTTADVKFEQLDDNQIRLYMDQDVETMGMNVEVIQVIDGRDLYIKLENQDWEKYNLDDENDTNSLGGSVATTYDQLLDQQFLNQIEEFQQLEVMGSEEIDGIDTYKYKVTNYDAVVDAMSDQLTGSLVENYKNAGIEINEEDINFQVDSMDSYIWIEKETGYPVKQEVSNYNFSMKIKDILEADYKDVYIYMDFENINEEVNIEVPSV